MKNENNMVKIKKNWRYFQRQAEKRDEIIYQWIFNYFFTYKKPPRLKEIQRGLGITTRQRALQLMERLIDRGWITKVGRGKYILSAGRLAEYIWIKNNTE